MHESGAQGRGGTRQYLRPQVGLRSPQQKHMDKEGDSGLCSGASPALGEKASREAGKGQSVMWGDL